MWHPNFGSFYLHLSPDSKEKITPSLPNYRCLLGTAPYPDLVGFRQSLVAFVVAYKSRIITMQSRFRDIFGLRKTCAQCIPHNHTQSTQSCTIAQSHNQNTNFRTITQSKFKFCKFYHVMITIMHNHTQSICKVIFKLCIGTYTI